MRGRSLVCWYTGFMRQSMWPEGLRYGGAAALVFISVVAEWMIRCAVQCDLEPVLGLWAAAGSPPSVTDTREGLLALLATDEEALLLVVLNGTVIGSLIAAWDGWRGSFYRLAVHPDHRRRGIGTALLREGERRLRAQGAVRLTAIVADDEEGAMAFWRAAGHEHQQHRARLVRHCDG